ncbi:MAG: zf-HC2 domain-containing protein [Planctomycetota bacterium]|nr:zf-HC2 domain-containing protein [Planctomycetota bacterium]
MEFTCKEAVPMIGAYLDGELSPASAALLRPHLLECPACRNSTADGRALQRWFTPLRESASAPAVPSGFAARVARRAVAGDTGERSAPAAQEGKLLPFVLRLTAVAAAVTLMLALGVRLRSRPDAGSLSADDRKPLSMSQIQSELDRLNGVVPVEPAANETTPAEGRAARAKKRGIQEQR